MSTTLNLAKLARLEWEHEDRMAVTHAAGDRYRLARELRQQLESEVDRQRIGGHMVVRSTRQDDGTELREPVGPVSPVLLQQLERARATEAEARQRLDELNEPSTNSGRLLGRLEEYAKGAGVDLRRLPPPASLVRSAGPAPTIEQVEEVRRRNRELKNRRKSMARAAVAKVEAAERIDAWLDAQAARLEMAGGAFILQDSSHARFRLFVERDVEEGGPATDACNWAVTQALFARLTRPALRDELLAAAEQAAAARGGWGVSGPERSARLAELDAQIFSLELEEERLTEELQARGVGVERRPDADPRAVLAMPSAGLNFDFTGTPAMVNNATALH
jgi:hypothetical protein